MSVFSVEMLVKLGALGLMGYLRDPWNILDGFIVVMSWINTLLPLMITMEDSGAGNLSGLRSFRALRPLRAVMLQQYRRERDDGVPFSAFLQTLVEVRRAVVKIFGSRRRRRCTDDGMN